MKEGENNEFHLKAATWAAHLQSFIQCRKLMKKLTPGNPEYDQLKKMKERHGEIINLLAKDRRTVDLENNSNV